MARSSQELLKWVVKRNQSFLNFEFTVFQQLIKKSRPNIPLLSADILKRRIKYTFDEKRKEVKVWLGVFKVSIE
jgi:hypothetical protein